MAKNEDSGRAGFGLPEAVWRPVADFLAAGLTLAAMGWALSLQRKIGLDLYPQQFFAGILFFVLPLAFLSLPANRNAARQVVPWYDLAMAIIAAIAVGYVAIGYPHLVLMIFARPLEVWLPGLIVILLMLEALRRATGWALVLIIAVFLLYALFGDAFPGRLQGRAQNWQLLAGYMAVDSNGILGLPISVASTVVVSFIFFGVLLGITGGTRFFTDAAMILMGRFRGGSMKIAV
ncbi:MAG: TRAP transporter large permease subunit, partial [Paracoccaceae bacterium]|nr:TRAP transporter large permease subunit [Paracoccaceae bacterium]